MVLVARALMCAIATCVMAAVLGATAYGAGLYPEWIAAIFFRIDIGAIILFVSAFVGVAVWGGTEEQ